MKNIVHDFGWTEKRNWAWPDDDVKLLQVIDDVHDIDLIMQHVPTAAPECVVQAGGACGVWPLRLSQIFQSVLTFEPLRSNFECLDENTRYADNVFAIPAALGSGDEATRCRMVQHPNERQNAGSHQVSFDVDPSEEFVLPVVTIDDTLTNFSFRRVDLIALDLEGYEMAALHGAQRTIQEFRPTIVVEDKGLSDRYGVRKGDVVRWLKHFHGYAVAANIKRDVVMVPA